MVRSTANGDAVFCRDLVKTYGKGDTRVVALNGVNLDVHPGELLMLVGPSGCGKTTLLCVVAGILNRDSGQCSVFGRDFRSMGRRERSRYRGENIGFVFQSFNLIPTLSAAENVAIPLILNGVARREALRRADALLEKVGLGRRQRDLPSRLSGGQQQRVAIARAMIHNPRLIVCDEPTSALDHETGHHVMELLREVAVGPDRALVIVTHDARIFGFADRIAQMDDGRIVRVVNSPAELSS
ncbi:MAG: ABC transporter ATP-binding protein [Phycisphaerales bacterium]|nr:ABC transporter ATP-binding protein [Phycisphaerales bacterium]